MFDMRQKLIFGIWHGDMCLFIFTFTFVCCCLFLRITCAWVWLLGVLLCCTHALHAILDILVEHKRHVCCVFVVVVGGGVVVGIHCFARTLHCTVGDGDFALTRWRSQCSS